MNGLDDQIVYFDRWYKFNGAFILFCMKTNAKSEIILSWDRPIYFIII